MYITDQNVMDLLSCLTQVTAQIELKLFMVK